MTEPRRVLIESGDRSHSNAATPPDWPPQWRPIVEIDDRSVLVALRSNANPLDPAFDPAGMINAIDAAFGDADAPSILIGWSGTLADALFADEPRTWLPGARRCFDTRCGELAEALRIASRRLLFQPHVRHVLSDVASTRTALRSLDGRPFGLALAPSTLLTRSMLADIDDHLERIFAGLGAIAELVILDDLSCSDADATGGESNGTPDAVDSLPRLRPLGHGVLPRDLLLRLIDLHVPTTTPLVVGSASSLDPDAARRWMAS